MLRLKKNRNFTSKAGSLNWLLSFVLLTVLAACSVRTIEPNDSALGYDYFPLELESFLVYQVEEITYVLPEGQLTRSYQLKELVADTFTDLSGDKAYRIHRFTRPSEANDWQLDSVWTAKRTASRAIRTENNQYYVKLIFPVKENSTWNGNILNNLDTLDYRVRDRGKAFGLPQRSFANTVKVFQKSDTLSIIGRDKRLEVYASGIGLVYKEFVTLQYCSASPDCVGDATRVSFGTEYYQRLIDYEKK
jgi:hypothetical protein